MKRNHTSDSELISRYWDLQHVGQVILSDAEEREAEETWNELTARGFTLERGEDGYGWEWVKR
jgi:hypothetical protein